ncbi:2-hydroxy-3-oxopropionate reductase [Pseudobythopirellula maris]|uniref:2-hydroxy-3-oxopropionate reductase n=1 Tax=Pseudobythopirellula maris TaxID=2527991 RepID=A0A5C5ZVJ5_9BACT|nr:NAD(P)-dependent oxidoreductase [Pseudobythopirellula maris]TWT91078.1 2-hydroxy-3-oxopropionate reductase [Pseudobythopirellula maris]
MTEHPPAATPTNAAPVAVIGLGLLGSALCERLIGAGFPVRVWNRSREKAAPLEALGARWSDNPLSECDRAVICLYTSGVVGEVLTEMDEGVRSGQTYLDCTTGNPDETTALAERLADRGVDYIECPIAASSDQTRRGQAVAFVGGADEAVARCGDLLAAIAPKSFHCGPSGSAAKMKLVNNLVLGLNRVALAEGLVFAKALGLDGRRTLDTLSKGNAHSGVMDTKGLKMVDGDFALQAKLTQHAKDVGIILEQAAEQGLRLPFSQLHLETLRHGEAMGLGEADNSAVISAIEDAARAAATA